MTFGKRLEEAMKAKNMTGRELSRLSMVPEISISKYIHDEYVAGQVNLVKLANALGVSPQWLVSGNETVEENLVAMFRALDEEDKRKVISYMEFLTSEAIKEKSYKQESQQAQ